MEEEKIVVISEGILIPLISHAFFSDFDQLLIEK